jgi:hypothetical protein
MHSSVELSSGDFAIAVDGERASLTDVLPGFDGHSRLGIVLRDDFGVVGASGLLLAAVTAFYDSLRERYPDGFFRYADFFHFHAGGWHGNHNMLDVFPAHKEVVVDDEPEQLLQAINDRAVTHLLLPEGESRHGTFQRQTVNAARERLRGAALYAPRGRVQDADVEIGGNEHADHYVWATVDTAAYADSVEADGSMSAEAVAWFRSTVDDVPADARRRILAERESLRVDGRIVESFRRIGVEEALERL